MTMIKYFVLLFLTSCSSYKYPSDYEITNNLINKEKNGISQLIDKIGREDEGNRLVSELNLANAYFYYGEYEKSIAIYQMIKKKHDYFQLTTGEELNKYLLGDEVNKFQLPVADFLYVCVFNSINYIYIRDYKNARAELRSCEHIGDYLIEKQPENKHHFSYYYYMLGMMSEYNGDFSNAIIYYKKSLKLNNNNPFIEFDIEANQNYFERGYGDDEILILVFSGIGPSKTKHKNSHAVPIYQGGSMTFTIDKMGLNNQNIGEGYELINLSKELKERQDKLYKSLIVKSMTSDITRTILMAPIDVITGGITLLPRLLTNHKLDGDFRYWDFVFNSITINRVKVSTNNGVVSILGTNKKSKHIRVNTKKYHKETVLIKTMTNEP